MEEVKTIYLKNNIEDKIVIYYDNYKTLTAMLFNGLKRKAFKPYSLLTAQARLNISDIAFNITMAARMEALKYAIYEYEELIKTELKERYKGENL